MNFFDVVTVQKISEMVYSAGLEIEGHVFNPGRKAYKKNMTVYDLIFFQGGFNHEEHLVNTFL